MAWWSKKGKQEKSEEPEVEHEPAQAEAEPRPEPARRRQTNLPMEVRLLSVQACESGLTAKEVAELAGVHTSTVGNWSRIYRNDGLAGLARRTTSSTTRRICKALEERITEHRQAHPEHGVRRIRDELHRDQGLSVSAETVRRVVNDADLGQPPPKAHRSPVQVRRFERSIPNGHGLFRQQKADAVMEVVKGAVGQWGAPREILSDNGRQFVAWRGKSAFQKLLVRQGIGHVRSAPHHPMTLGKIERFWKTVWTEFLEDAVFASFADATQRLEHWMAYYNHQRPHQGIAGACPSDRFYGMADDVEAALGQGCRENSLRLALGQEPEPPLYLLGKLGGTDVRVTRKGEEIEVKLGDQVHEVIRMGAPYTLDDQGQGHRREDDDEVERTQRRGAVPGGGDGPQGGGAAEGDLRDVWRVPPDAVPGDAQSGRGLCRGPGAAAPGPEGQVPGRGGDGRTEWPGGRAAEGSGALENEVRDRQGLFGAGEEVRPGRAPGLDALGRAEKKAPTKEEEQASQEVEPSMYDLLCWTGADDEGGGSE